MWRILPAVVVMVLVATGYAEGARPEALDLSAWEAIPVFDARIKPLDTFAREVVEKVCGREEPTLDPRACVTEEEWNSERMAGARELFPDGKERKFRASELVLSWLIESDKWEYIPFLLAKHEEVRKALNVPLKNEEDHFIAYVSPAQVFDSIFEENGIQSRLEEIDAKRMKARAEKRKFQARGADKRVEDLAQAYQIFRAVTFNPLSESERRTRFMEKSRAVGWAWRDTGLATGLHGLSAHPDTATAANLKEIASWSQAIGESLQAIEGKLRESGGGFSVAEIEPDVVKLKSNARRLADFFAASKSDALKSLQGTNRAGDPHQAMQALTQLAVASRSLANYSHELHISLYDNFGEQTHQALRVVPALNAAALERNRGGEMDPEEPFLRPDFQPWTTLQMILVGSPDVLTGFPENAVGAVRNNFAQLGKVFTDRQSSSRPAAVKAAAEQLAASLRVLGTGIEPVRRELPIVQLDERMLAYTAYPPLGSVSHEIQYNKLQPFRLSWIISLAAVFCFALSFGVLRRPLFWLGMAVMLFGLGWVAYGFYLRVAISGWAPVTNMYETVIYVPFFVSGMAAWMAWLPVTWTGISHAWRMTAVPWIWEAAPLTKEQTSFLPASAWTAINWLTILPRLAMTALVWWILAVAPYAAGGRTIIHLVPIEGWESLVSLNNALTWAVGITVFLPSVWYLPRVMLTLVYGVLTVPGSMRGHVAERLGELPSRWAFLFAGSFVAFLGSFVAWYSPVLDESFTPLQPVLRDNFWLTIHVLTIVSSYGAGALAWGLGNIALTYYLFGRYREPAFAIASAEHRPAHDVESFESRRRPPEQCATLANFIYRAVQVAVLLLAAGTILGGLWADKSWGRFWGWDPKEVWALISLLVYVAILHGRYVGWFGNFGMAAGAVLGASAIVFSWYGVNFVLGVGLHSYGFGAGGQWEVGTAVAANWLFLLAAAIRYHWETAPKTVGASSGSEATTARAKRPEMSASRTSEAVTT